MKLAKRILSILMCIVMILCLVFSVPASASAADENIAQTGDAGADIVAFARTHVGKYSWDLGYTFPWCAAFVSYCASNVGQANAIPYDTFVSNMYSSVIAAGGYEVSTPRAGDLVIYTCTVTGQMCHVGIMYDSYNSIQGNVAEMVKDMPYTWYVDEVGFRDDGYHVKCYSVRFLRPNYSGSSLNLGDAVNLGDNFYASIVKTDSGVYAADVSANVQLADHTAISDYSHIWNFVRHSDGYYVIYNCASGNALDVSGEGKVQGTNVGTYKYWGSDAQKWYIYGSQGKYVLKPKLCSLVLDVYGNYNDFGSNLSLWDYNGSAAQLFTIEKQPAATTPTLTVDEGDYKTLTTFSFSSDSTTRYYRLVVSRDDNGTMTNYLVNDMVQNNKIMYNLPEGNYEAYAEAFNGYSTTRSSVVKFSIAKAPVVGDDGWTYSDKLYPEITTSDYEIQYLNTYSQISTTSPGEGWTKGELAKTEYVNSGDPYWSYIELPTSETRTLVNYIYYHYCGASNGNNANFTATSAYPHYDWLSKDGVYEASVNTDYDDSRYKFYHLKWNNGGDAYCSSGVSCDGSYGSHGNRTCYWYKYCQYQDKTQVNYYNYTKPSVWSTSADSDATSVTYRYRLRTDGILGDVNNDGKVTINDVTQIQKYCAQLVSLGDTALKCADVTFDGKVTISDATRIQKYVALIIDSL